MNDFWNANFSKALYNLFLHIQTDQSVTFQHTVFEVHVPSRSKLLRIICSLIFSRTVLGKLLLKSNILHITSYLVSKVIYYSYILLSSKNN